MNHRATALGLILGLALGLLASATDIDLLSRAAAGVAPLGTLFINAIRMVVIPLVVTTIFVGVARLGSPKELGKLGGSALGFFWATTVPAIVIGMVFMKIALRVSPVAVLPSAAGEGASEIPGLLDFFLRLIPSNPFAAAAEGALLPLIVFTLLVGAAAGALAEERRQRLITLAEDISEMFMRLIHWILWTAPAGVFGLAAPVVARMGLDLLAGLAVFVATVMLPLTWSTIAHVSVSAQIEALSLRGFETSLALATTKGPCAKCPQGTMGAESAGIDGNNLVN